MPRLVVTGASGFIGSAIAGHLAARFSDVVGIGRSAPLERKFNFAACDFSDLPRLTELFADAEAVFHAGGKVDHSGSPAEFRSANVGGTESVVEACRRSGVPFLIFTSTPSVLADGSHHFEIDESHPYPPTFLSPYCETKAIAERIVRSANTGSLHTICLRPHMVWGPGKSQWVRGFTKLAARGRLVQIGSGRNRVGMTYIDDCVSGHIAAWESLVRNPGLGGKIYFIHGGEPVFLWEWVRAVLEVSGLRPPTLRIPSLAAESLGSAFDLVARAFAGRVNFPLSRYLANELANDHYSSIRAAVRDLNYRPTISQEEGLARIARGQENTRHAPGSD